MASVEYKILFEVRFLHDYYLYGVDPGGDGRTKSFFAMSAKSQSARLVELLKSGQYDIRKDLDVIVGAADERLIKSLRMKFVRTATGFFLGMQVKRVVSSSGEIRFQPVISPSEDTCITIGLSIANPFFGSISNLRLDQDVDKIYYFTNEGVHHDLSLASPISQIVPGQQYRMGDLALVTGNVKQALADNIGNSHWWTAVDGNGFIHQGDRSLSPVEDWYARWRATVGLRSKHPAGVIKIALMSGNGQLSPIDENKFLTTRFPSTIEDRAHSTIQTAVHPVFELRWLSRATYWRYRKRDGFSARERSDIMLKAGSLLADEDGQFVTKEPWPIIRERRPSLLPELSIRLPYAQPGLIKAEGGKVFSDIEFNELNPLP